MNKVIENVWAMQNELRNQEGITGMDSMHHILMVLLSKSFTIHQCHILGIPEEFAFEGQWVELIGQTRTIDMVAQEAGTIGHEILTSLGTRYNRIYTNEEFTNEPIQS